MNLLNLLDKMCPETSSPEEKDMFFSRREAFRQFGDMGKKVAMAAVPLGLLSALPKVAKADTASLIGVLNFALTLEHLEYRYYQMGIESGVIAGADAAIFNKIRDHELAHVNFLSEVISSVLKGTPVSEPAFDFTAGGNFSPFTDYPTFLALSQAFEDTGVRAYKGQAGNVMENDVVLTAALSIHSVEARHASMVRRLRTKKGQDTVKGWITNGSIGTLPAATQAIYTGEENVTHGGVNVVNLTGIDAGAVSEGWDEPLNKDQVLGIASLFLA
ncbi:ferritin-like domain-containing protein [Algoriphagus aquimarinus]|uniref:Ferritin-like domain-containing protein n=1 Tax=Algoriphagus aquimarinus TaxID=237018 RepID=A0A1I1BV70_9BACT|nr:ferritin-like domain-containing protein [Algoriphagus aquimarinus]SFB52370.1 Ferritin-like domain-containing protein [Algoriphagus aquimarinus]|tara:strand:+ start:16058 stop:16876 length:819 start_codon:yes stop_codon:yes gene_type:complete